MINFRRRKSQRTLKKSEFPFYTGFPSKEVFYAVLTLVNPGERGYITLNTRTKRMNKNTVEVESEQKSNKLSPDNQFLLVLCRVKDVMFEINLARRFNVSVGVVSTICYNILGKFLVPAS